MRDTSDYGAMNEAVHGKLEELKRANPHLGREAAQPAAQNASLGSIQEMQRIVEKFPEMTKMKENVCAPLFCAHARAHSHTTTLPLLL